MPQSASLRALCWAPVIGSAAAAVSSFLKYVTSFPSSTQGIHEALGRSLAVMESFDQATDSSVSIKNGAVWRAEILRSPFMCARIPSGHGK